MVVVNVAFAVFIWAFAGHKLAKMRIAIRVKVSFIPDAQLELLVNACI